MLSNLSSLVSNLTAEASQMAEVMKAKLEKEALEFKREEEIYSKGATIDVADEVPIWEKCPSGWDGHRRLEWAMLVRVLPQDEETFLVGPSRGLSEDERERLTKIGVTIDPLLAEPVDSYMPCAALSMEKGGTLDQARFNLVPAKVKEPEFWRNYFWKCQELGKCSCLDQVAALLLVINCPLSKREAADPAHHEKAQQHETKVRQLLTSLFTMEKGRLWLEEHSSRIEEEVRTARESIQLLEQVLRRAAGGDRPPDELMESLFNSCKYRKQKVSTLVGDLTEHCPWQCDEQQTQLLELNEALKEVLTRYRLQFQKDLGNAGSSGIQSSGTPQNDCVDGDDLDDEFDTKMPWEE